MPKSIMTVCALALLAAGCSEQSERRTPDQVDQDNLTQVGELYRHYQATKNKPAQKFADLIAVRNMGANGYEAVRAGTIVLRYGATLPDTGEEPGQAESDEVLAYQQQVPESGGKVLMLNRTVKTMTAGEFKAAKMAGKEEPVSKKK
jgi:hypothetical protein